MFTTMSQEKKNKKTPKPRCAIHKWQRLDEDGVCVVCDVKEKQIGGYVGDSTYGYQRNTRHPEI